MGVILQLPHQHAAPRPVPPPRRRGEVSAEIVLLPCVRRERLEACR